VYITVQKLSLSCEPRCFYFSTFTPRSLSTYNS